MKGRAIDLCRKNALRLLTENKIGRQRIYMGTFTIAVSIGLFENFHRATIFKQSKRVMPRAPSMPEAPSLIETSAGLLVGRYCRSWTFLRTAAIRRSLGLYSCRSFMVMVKVQMARDAHYLDLGIVQCARGTAFRLGDSANMARGYASGFRRTLLPGFWPGAWLSSCCCGEGDRTGLQYDHCKEV